MFSKFETISAHEHILFPILPSPIMVLKCDQCEGQHTPDIIVPTTRIHQCSHGIAQNLQRVHEHVIDTCPNTFEKNNRSNEDEGSNPVSGEDQ